MEIHHTQDAASGAFFLQDGNDRVGEIAYRKHGHGSIVIDHTEVNEAHKGEGLGEKLVFAVADFARKKQLSVIPRCSFAKALFQRKTELQDVLAQAK